MWNPFARPVTAYWWKELPNFGDALAPYLLEHFADLTVQWGPISQARIASIGSVLEHIPPLWDGYILGSGRIAENSRTHLIQMTTGISAKILALRGPLTARGIKGDYAIGDPGILAAELVEREEKQYDTGIVPHWSDDELVPRFKALIPATQRVLAIDPRQNPLDVIKQISSCHKIVSSSLHGVIVADSLNVPRRIEMCKGALQDGGDFKFRDYCASIHQPLVVGKVQSPERIRVEDVKFEIYDAFRELKRMLK